MTGDNKKQEIAISTDAQERDRSMHTAEWIKVIPFLALFVFLVLIGWGIMTRGQQVIKKGEPAPDFTLQTYSGQTISLSDLQGKIVLLNFWASWCTPCETEAPAIEAAWQQYKDNDQVIFLGVAYADTNKGAGQFIKAQGISYLNGPDLGAKISDAYQVHAVPETYLIDGQGDLVLIKVGPFKTEREIVALIENLLQ